VTDHDQEKTHDLPQKIHAVLQDVITENVTCTMVPDTTFSG